MAKVDSLCAKNWQVSHRYLDFLAATADPRLGLRALEKVATPFTTGAQLPRLQPVPRPCPGSLPRDPPGEFTISGFQARQFQGHLAGLSGAQLSCCLKRLQTHGLIKKIGKRYNY